MSSSLKNFDFTSTVPDLHESLPPYSGPDSKHPDAYPLDPSPLYSLSDLKGRASLPPARAPPDKPKFTDLQLPELTPLPSLSNFYSALQSHQYKKFVGQLGYCELERLVDYLNDVRHRRSPFCAVNLP